MGVTKEVPGLDAFPVGAGGGDGVEGGRGGVGGGAEVGDVGLLCGPGPGCPLPLRLRRGRRGPIATRFLGALGTLPPSPHSFSLLNCVLV